MERSELVYDVIRLLRPLVLNSARVVERRVRAEGWTVGMRAVVEVLAARGDSTVPEIARTMDLPRQAVQRHVNDLLGHGHVVTQENPAHRRSVLVALTGPGIEAFDRVRSAELSELADLAGEHSAAELRTAARVLASLDRDIRAKTAGTREVVAP